MDQKLGAHGARVLMFFIAPGHVCSSFVWFLIWRCVIQNIEDAAREAGSIDFTLEDVEAAITDTLKNMEDDVLGGPFRQLNGMLTRLKVWLQKYMLERGAQLPAAKEAFEAICRPRGAHVTSEVCRSSGVVKLDGTQLQCLWSGGQVGIWLRNTLHPICESCFLRASDSCDPPGKQ